MARPDLLVTFHHNNLTLALDVRHLWVALNGAAAQDDLIPCEHVSSGKMLAYRGQQIPFFDLSRHFGELTSDRASNVTTLILQWGTELACISAIDVRVHQPHESAKRSSVSAKHSDQARLLMIEELRDRGRSIHILDTEMILGLAHVTPVPALELAAV